MKHTKLFYLLFTFLVSVNTFAQTEPELSIALLDNDNIASVNINQDSFVKSFGKITDLASEEFKGIGKSQKIAILIVVHKEGKPTIELYSKPKISNEQEDQFLLKLKSENIENTKLVDFPILILLNSKFEEYSKDFRGLISPAEKRKQEYMDAGLKRRFELNKEYAIEVLSVLSAFQVIVDDKFAGVKDFGKLVEETDFKEEQNIVKLTNENSNYWRAIMEMSVGNQLIPITKIFMLASQGEFDYAMKYIEIISAFSDAETVPDKYLKELADRLMVFNQQLDAKIQEGIAYHDKGQYAKAITIYKDILNEYPNSAWTKYELFFSQNALSTENNATVADDRAEWDNAKPGIYKSNPLYPMDVRASNGREGYLLFRRAEIMQLFKDSKNRLSDIYEYADIAMDLAVYDFAAQLFWISINFDKKDSDALYKYLYCLEKLGVTNLKDNFKGDFKQEFKKIEKDKEEEMIESKTYKSFEN